MTSLDLENKFDTIRVEDMRNMFFHTGNKAMTSLNLRDKFDTSNVKDMTRMFSECGQTAMTSLDLGDKFYTTNVTDMYQMFYNCGTTAMTTLDLGSAFTKIPSGYFEEKTLTWTDGEGNQQTSIYPAHNAYDDFMTNCGTSTLVVYAPESIYANINAFKLNKAGQ